MDPAMPHAIWGFTGTERPGAAYLPPPWQATLRSVSRLGIYGEQDAD